MRVGSMETFANCAAMVLLTLAKTAMTAMLWIQTAASTIAPFHVAVMVL